MSNLINGSRFFKHVLPFIGDKSMIVEELIENAVRAKAKNVDIDISDNVITCFNNGNVLKDFTSLLTVATTNYDAEVVKSQCPAGMGIMMLLSVCKKAVFASGFKSIEVDAKRFFNDDIYRSELADVLENQGDLVGANYVSGFSTTLYCDGGFAEFIKSVVLLSKYGEDGFDGVSSDIESKYRYYDINIKINGFKVAREKHQWLVYKKGVGVFDGCEIGIKGNVSVDDNVHFREQGCVYWFGKKISCPEISPFVIVVNSETECLRPSLPDRRSISTDGAKLESLKCELENLFVDDIQSAIIDKIYGGNFNDVCFIGNLKSSFNVEHFTHWGNFNIDSVNIAYQSNVNMFCNGSACSMGEFGGGVFEIDNRFGGTKAPLRLLAKFTDQLDVVVEHYDKSTDCYIGNVECEQVKSINVNGHSIRWFIDEDDWEIRFVDCEDDFIDFVYKYCSVDDSTQKRCEVEQDCKDVMNHFNGKLDVSDFKGSLMGFLKLKQWSDSDDVTVRFGKGVLNVDFNGESFEVKTA